MEHLTSVGPVQIVSITDDHKFVLDEQKLRDILYHRRAQGKKVEIQSNCEEKENFLLFSSSQFLT